MSGCSNLAQKEYKKHHDKVALRVHWHLSKKYDLESEDQKRRPCSNLPEMTRRTQKPLGMLCLATLRSAFGGSSFSTYRPGCVENEDPTVIHKR